MASAAGDPAGARRRVTVYARACCGRVHAPVHAVIVHACVAFGSCASLFVLREGMRARVRVSVCGCGYVRACVRAPVWVRACVRASVRPCVRACVHAHMCCAGASLSAELCPNGASPPTPPHSTTAVPAMWAASLRPAAAAPRSTCLTCSSRGGTAAAAALVMVAPRTGRCKV
jgi:hypothetical protein